MDPTSERSSCGYRIARLNSREQKPRPSRISRPRFAQFSTNSCSMLPGWCSVGTLWRSPGSFVTKRSGRSGHIFGHRERSHVCRLVDAIPNGMLGVH